MYNASAARIQEMQDGLPLTTYNLREAVQVPRAVEAQDWPTSTSRDYKGARTPETFAKTGRNAMTNSLADAVEIGPPRTDSGPPAQDSGSTGGNRQESWATPTGDDANNATRASGAFQSLTRQAGKLNPSWVETLMAFPIGWSQLPTKFQKPRKKTP